ncbi:hypothetical protein WME97_40065 [Sorangium sp. So ce367]|uniref:hypothetical protein n=1 Tax=Sorangium sp. So ce367 TaxID=3133305 RepID=UPI003F5F0A0E
MVPARLAKNRKLHRTIASGSRQAWIAENALYQQSMSIPVNANMLMDLFSLIVRGLVWFHWKALITQAYSVNVLILTDAEERYFDDVLNFVVADRATVDLGNSTVQYEGVQGVDDPAVSAWRISMYGGIMFGDSSRPGLIGCRIGAITGPVDSGSDTEL